MSIGPKKSPVKKLPGWIKWNSLTSEFEIPRDRIDTLETIYQMAMRGEGTAAIARHLNSANIPTFSTIKKETSRGKLWTPETVNLILHSPALKGAYQPVTTFVDSKSHRRKRSKAEERDRIDGFFPAFLDSKQWRELQNILNLRSKNHGRGNKRNVTNLFGSLLTYGPDKSPIVITSNQNNQRIMTSRLMQAGKTKKISFPYDVFEFVFLKRMGFDSNLSTATGEELRILRSALRLKISQSVQSVRVWFAGDSCNRRCCVCKVVRTNSSTHLFSIRKRRGKPPETEPLGDVFIEIMRSLMGFEKWVESINTKEEIPDLIPLEDWNPAEPRKPPRKPKPTVELTDEELRALAEKYNQAVKRSAEENSESEGLQITDEMKEISRQAGAEFVGGELKPNAKTAKALIELTYQMCMAEGEEFGYWMDPDFYVEYFNLKLNKKFRDALKDFWLRKENPQPSEENPDEYIQFDNRCATDSIQSHNSTVELTDESYRDLAEKYTKAYFRSAEENPSSDGIRISDEMKDILREAGAGFDEGELKNNAITAKALIELTYQTCQIDGGNYWKDPEHYVDFYRLKSDKKIRDVLRILVPEKRSYQASEHTPDEYNQFV